MVKLEHEAQVLAAELGALCFAGMHPVFSTDELVNALEQEKAQGKAGQIANRLIHSDLVIFDELGYLPFSVSGGALLLDRLTHHCHIMETGNDSFRFKNSSAQQPEARKEKTLS